MDSKYNDFSVLIENNKEKYPNLCLLWEKYIEIKKKKLQKELDTAINKLNNINILDNDINLQQVYLLLLLNQI